MTRHCDRLRRIEFWFLILAATLIGSGWTAKLYERSQQQILREAAIERHAVEASARAQAKEEVAAAVLEANQRAEHFAELAYRRMDSATDDLGRIATRVSRTASKANTAAATAKQAAQTAGDAARAVDQAVTPAPAVPASAPEWLN